MIDKKINKYWVRELSNFPQHIQLAPLAKSLESCWKCPPNLERLFTWILPVAKFWQTIHCLPKFLVPNQWSYQLNVLAPQNTSLRHLLARAPLNRSTTYCTMWLVSRKLSNIIYSCTVWFRHCHESVYTSFTRLTDLPMCHCCSMRLERQLDSADTKSPSQWDQDIQVTYCQWNDCDLYIWIPIRVFLASTSMNLASSRDE
jgi:hypothetical protein